jgi:hypothetical protein
MALAVKGADVLALCQTANSQLATQDLPLALKTAEEAVALAESSGVKSAKGSALLTLATIQAYDNGTTKAALDSAKKAKSCFADCFDTASEGACLAVIGNIHKENIAVMEPGSDAQKEAFQGAFRNSKEAIRLMKMEGVDNCSKDALATACLNVAMTGTIAQKAKEGLPAAKEAMDLYEELGDKMGQCMAMCYLAELHVLAGHGEDWQRLSMFLPMAKGHTAAAGYWAEKAQAMSREVGFQEGVDRMGGLLTHERVQKDAAFRSLPFDYDKWTEVPTCK